MKNPSFYPGRHDKLACFLSRMPTTLHNETGRLDFVQMATTDVHLKFLGFLTQ